MVAKLRRRICLGLAGCCILAVLAMLRHHVNVCGHFYCAGMQVITWVYCDWGAYITRYNDLRVLTLDEAQSHYLRYGHAEARICRSFTKQEFVAAKNFMPSIKPPKPPLWTSCTLKEDDIEIRGRHDSTVGVIIRTYSGHASSLEGLIRGIKLAASCALVEVFFVIVLTEGGPISELMANKVVNKFAQMSHMATTKIRIVSHQSARVRDVISKASPSIPHCSPEVRAFLCDKGMILTVCVDHLSFKDLDYHKFGERIWCRYKGNPISTNTCDECMIHYKTFHTGDAYNQLISKICLSHNYMDYVLTDEGLKIVQDDCPECKHFLVTNGDNVYSKVKCPYKAG
jgi:hypothetical protein